MKRKSEEMPPNIQKERNEMRSTEEKIFGERKYAVSRSIEENDSAFDRGSAFAR